MHATYAETSDDTTVYHLAGKNRVHVDGCQRLTNDPDERAKMAKMTLSEAKAKGLEPCSKCPDRTTPGKDDAGGGKAEGGEAIVLHMPGKKRVHLPDCKRLPQDPAELAKFIKMTLAEARAKGLEPCSKCPGSTTPGKSDPKGADGDLESWVKPAPDHITKKSFIPSRLAP
ncbi:MAG: hypothetical protein KDN05_11550, partial [Verrucomicrobiae bacterium]|nr:hypothetical protein [Verrucomicrobiae bacterium]